MLFSRNETGSTVVDADFEATYQVVEFHAAHRAPYLLTVVARTGDCDDLSDVVICRPRCRDSIYYISVVVGAARRGRGARGDGARSPQRRQPYDVPR